MRLHSGADGFHLKDGDPVPVVGPQDVGTPGTHDGNCGNTPLEKACIDNDVDAPDPTFSGPLGTLSYEEVAGQYGTWVDRTTVKQVTGGTAYGLVTVPYYRDDSCFDDGTGNDPGPHIKSRAVDSGTGTGFEGDAGQYYDPSSGSWQPRVCWKPKDGDPQDASVGDGRPRKFWNADIATHGLHINLIADSDNAYQTVPIDEVDSEQRMVVLPPHVVDPARTMRGTVNVGERFGRSVEYPLQVAVTPFS